MTHLFRLETENSIEHLLELLLETLGMEFRQLGGTWVGESYGGSRFELIQESATQYALSVQHDPTHPLFSDQEKSFCSVQAFPEWIATALTRSGVRCVFTG